MKAILCALALAFPASLQAQTVAVETASGQVEAPEQPGKVVALDFAAIDTLQALKVDLAGRPDLTLPAYLGDGLAEVPTVGTLFEPDFEALASMAPDLIIAGGRSQTQVPALSKVAETLDMTIDGTDLIEQAKSRIASYGAIFARQDEAEALSAQLDTAVGEAKAAAEGKGGALILMANGGKVSAFGAKSRFGWLHTALNVPEAYPGLEMQNHGEAVSFEFIADADPDWLLVIDRGAAIGEGGQAAAATLDNPLVAGTTAGKKNQIVYLDSAAMYLADGGYQSMMLLLDQLKQAFDGTNS